MTTKRWIALAAVVVGAIAIAAILFGRSTREARPAGSKVDARAAHDGLDDERDNQRSHTDLSGDSQARRHADEMRARIHALQSRTPSAQGAAPQPGNARMPALVGSGNQAQQPLGEYVRATVREQFLPMARGCYEELLTRERNARGKVALHIIVVGDPSVGGVVDSVQLDSESTLNDPEILTCLVESMMALSFDAPPEGHDKVEFDYPFEFSPDAHDASR